MRGLALALAAFATTAAAQTPPPVPAAPPAQIQPAPIGADVQRTLDRLREAALRDDAGYAIVQDLVTRIGPRIAGSEQEARARDWAVAMLRANRFSNVHIETFPIPGWSWQRQEARIVSPSQQRLVIAALGNSPSTPAGGVEAEIVRFPDLPSLQAAPEAAVRGRIVFIDERMTRTQDASGYGAAVAKRAAARAGGAERRAGVHDPLSWHRYKSLRPPRQRRQRRSDPHRQHVARPMRTRLPHCWSVGRCACISNLRRRAIPARNRAMSSPIFAAASGPTRSLCWPRI